MLLELEYNPDTQTYYFLHSQFLYPYPLFRTAKTLTEQKHTDLSVKLGA
jgi:hypothetical protein